MLCGDKTKTFTHVKKNISHYTLVDPKKVLLPPTHIKMGLNQQNGDCLIKVFKYFCRKFPFKKYLQIDVRLLNHC